MKFIDPRIDFAFKKIFGSDDAKDILISFLESLLELEGDQRIAELTFLDPFMDSKNAPLNNPTLEARCQDYLGMRYIVAMQVEKTDPSLKRSQYFANTAYVFHGQGQACHKLIPVIAITLSDYPLFDGLGHWVSHHQFRETITGKSLLQQIQYYFIELPKFTKSLEDAQNILELWICFFKYADSLNQIPEKMRPIPAICHAFEKASLANMNADELEFYGKIALTNAQS